MWAVVTLWLMLECCVRGGVAGWELPPPTASYKILVVVPVSMRSHNILFVAVAEALAERGHQVVILSNSERPLCSHPNISEVLHGLTYNADSEFDTFLALTDYHMFSMTFLELTKRTARDLYRVPAVVELYNRRKEFDLVVVDYRYIEVSLPFTHELPFVTMLTAGSQPLHSAFHGNVFSPSHVYTAYDGFSLSSTLRRMKDIFQSYIRAYIFKSFYVLPSIQEEISAHFPELPLLQELERNQSLALLNYHFSTHHAFPLMAWQVEIGAIHCRPARPLPPEVEAWVSGAGEDGVVYFSLGSVTRGSSLPRRYRQVVVEALGKLPMRVLWKYEEKLQDAPSNVMTVPWVSQQDVLGHRQVRVFVSHGGLLSLQEAIYHMTPLVVLPIFADQPHNSRYVREAGLGLTLQWEDITVDTLASAITEVVSKARYREKAASLSAQLRDQFSTPQQRAVFWMEYVIRHRGAPHLRSRTHTMSLVEILMLDVLLLLLGSCLVAVLVARRLLVAVRPQRRANTTLQ